MRTPEFWARDGLVPCLLAPASALWGAAAAARRRRASPAAAGAPVVCIGNAVAGGAGKTPVAMAVAAALARRGARPHLLSRGHGGSLRGPVRVDPARHGHREVGDEALLLAETAPAWVARDRLAGARAAAAAGAGVVVMDDGLQNLSLRRDFSVLVVDGPFGAGNGRLLPAGPLREPWAAALARSDAVVVVGEDRHRTARGAGRPALEARFVPAAESATISGRPVLAFAGIGRPEKFFETLSAMGCRLVDARGFPDHHRYTEDEVMRLVEAAAAAGAAAVTTRKDAVRLPARARDMVETLRVDLEWRDPEAFGRLVAAMPGPGGA